MRNLIYIYIGVHTFLRSINPKMNVIARLEFELTYKDVAVHLVIQYTTRGKFKENHYWPSTIMALARRLRCHQTKENSLPFLFFFFFDKNFLLFLSSKKFSQSYIFNFCASCKVLTPKMLAFLGRTLR